MQEIGQETFFTAWAQEVGKGFAFPGNEFFARVVPAAGFSKERNRVSIITGTANISLEAIEAELKVREAAWKKENPPWIVSTASDNVLIVRPESGRTRAPIEMARFIGTKRGAKKSMILMNGDGFDNRQLQTIQATIRNAMVRQFPMQQERMIVPYAALTSAGLSPASIEPIHISGDKTVSFIVPVPKPPKEILEKPENRPSVESGQRTVHFAYEDRRYTATHQYTNAPTEPLYQIMHQPEFSQNETWHSISLDQKTEGWRVTEQVHRLGSAVFTAVGSDGERHRWVSSFDQNERPPMYFLAQLPDKGGIRYLTHAIRLLAPEIVHKARAEGRRVFRQGDVFFIETKLTDADFASEKLANRHEVFTYQQHFAAMETSSNAAVTIVPVNANQTTLGYNFQIETGWQFSSEGTGDDNSWFLHPHAHKDTKLRRSIMIYGTGHTASVVVQTKDRGIFVKGTIYHDPILEDIRGGREAEHRPLRLAEGKWYLAVRNTVPRQSPTTTPVEGATNGNDSLPRVPRKERRSIRRVSERRLPSGAASGNR